MTSLRVAGLVVLLAACDDVAPVTITSDSSVDSSTSDASTSDSSTSDSSTTCPEGPFGTAIGATLADYVLYTCDGAPYPLASACDAPATYVNTFAGWCPPCRADAESAPADFEVFEAYGSGDHGGRWLFVITEDGGGDRPTLAYCAAIRDDYGLPMTVLVDLDGGFPAHMGVTSPNSWHFALSPGLVLEAKSKYDKAPVLELVDDLLTAVGSP